MFKICQRLKCVINTVSTKSNSRSKIIFNLCVQKSCSQKFLDNRYYKLQKPDDMSTTENSQPALKEDLPSGRSTCSDELDSNLKITELKDEKISELGQVSPKPILSKRAMKRQARAQQYKELKKRRKKEVLIQTGREEAGYSLDQFDQTSYYFENGLRKVYPYHFIFATYAKGRWVGRTLKNVLEKEFGFDQPEDVDKAFCDGKIHVNNVQVSVDYVVKDCDYISHHIHRHENPVTDSAIEILADTEEVVVINKPSSIPCHPCGRYRFNSVVFILGKEMGYSNLRNIYRLDRLTSGVLVLGKTVASTKRLEDQVVRREVQKQYVCRVEGEFPRETVTVDQPLMALSNKLRLQIISPKGKPSQTTFTRLSYNGRSSVVKCIPHTGRTHQIRVHLQYLGYPIINDVFYNSDAWGPNKGKDGSYQVPHDIVCSKILQKHQATQWEGGENPLFHEKLKEMEESTSASEKSETMVDSTSLENRDDQIDSKSSSTTTKAITTVTDNPTKQMDNMAGDLVPNEDEMTKTEKMSECTTGEMKSRKPTDGKDSAQSICPDLNPNVTIKPEGIRNLGVNQSDADMADKVVKERSTHPRPVFEWTEWHVDPSCDLCRKTTIDPKHRDLVMFLHALKYKGPGWEYETSLPDWAQDDWADEELFLLESTDV